MSEGPQQQGRAVPRIGQRAALATVAIAIGAGLVVARARPGLGLALVALAVVALAALARGPARLREPWRAFALAAATLLTLTPLIRDADWVVAGGLAIGLAFAVCALGDARSFAALGRSPLLFAGALIPAPAATVRGLAGLSPGSARSALPALRGAVIAASLLAVFGTLFASADGAFAHLVGQITPNLGSAGSLPARIGVALIAATVAGAVALAATLDHATQPAAPPRRSFPAIEWGIALGAVAGLFAIFVAVQFVVLFGGHEHVLDTAGLTYAEYARDGFAQLLVVAALAIGLVAGAWRWSRVEGPGQERALRWALAAICALTLVIVIAALHRLDLYVDAFGATRMRVVAAATCLWVGGLLALITVAVVAPRRAWLARAVLSMTALLAVAFVAADPEARIAQRNVERYEREGKFDIAYNAQLGADATPSLVALPPRLADRVLADERRRLRGADGPGGFNIARDRAREALSGP